MYIKSVGLRILAFIIDFFMIFGVGVLMSLLFGLGTFTRTATGFSLNFNPFEFTLCATIYFLSFAIIAKGLTVGKLITGLKIKDRNIEDVSYGKIIIRELFKGLFFILAPISFIVVLATEDKKSLHDLIVNTFVVKKVNKSGIFMEKQEGAFQENI